MVAPEGIVIVSPESPSCKPVPEVGETLFVFTSVPGTSTVSPDAPIVIVSEL